MNPSRVAVLLEVPDIDAVAAAMRTDDAAKAMGEDGVRGKTLVSLSRLADDVRPDRRDGAGTAVEEVPCD